jgi:undecaprenyl-diphosphatase
MWNTLIIVSAKYLIALPVIVLAAYFIFANRAQKYRLTWMAVIAMTLAYALARIASDLYNDPRPFVVGHFTPLVAHAADNGFPSDHTLLAATIAALVFYFNKTTGAVLFIVALLIGFSRVAAGIHHPVDVAGSAVIGIVAVIVAHYLVKGLRRAS